MLEQQIQQHFTRLNDSIEDLNRGGCAIVAYAMVRYINKRSRTTKAKVVYLQDLYEPSDACIHAYVKYRGMYYDSEGSYIKDELFYDCPFADIEVPKGQREVISSINKPGWNKRFNRKQSVPVIARLLDVPLQTIVKY